MRRHNLIEEGIWSFLKHGHELKKCNIPSFCCCPEVKHIVIISKDAALRSIAVCGEYHGVIHVILQGINVTYIYGVFCVGFASVYLRYFRHSPVSFIPNRENGRDFFWFWLVSTINNLYCLLRWNVFQKVASSSFSLRLKYV